MIDHVVENPSHQHDTVGWDLLRFILSSTEGVLRSQESGFLYKNIVFLSKIYVLNSVLLYFLNISMAKLGQRVLLRIRENTFSQLIALPHSFFEKARTGVISPVAFLKTQQTSGTFPNLSSPWQFEVFQPSWGFLCCASIWTGSGVQRWALGVISLDGHQTFKPCTKRGLCAIRSEDKTLVESLELSFRTGRDKSWKRRQKMVNVSSVGEIYKCELCGNVVEVKEAGGGELICCGEPMKLVK